MILINNYKHIPKILINKINTSNGRNKGKITVRHKGGGIKYLYTNVYFGYFNYNITTLALILKFYLDFSRTTIVMLVLILNGNLKGMKKLLLSTNYLKPGDLISFTSQFPAKVGSYRFLGQLFVGLGVHSITNIPCGKISISRSRGTSAKIIYHTSYYTCIKLPSGQFKLFSNRCQAVIGQNSILYKYKKIKKAGNRQFKNLRPTVRGVAMNAIDHPHGGGCGRTSIGLRSSKTPWGKFHYGVKTKSSKSLTRFINII